MGTIYLLVTSDVVTDQRVHRAALTLVEAGHSVFVIGRNLRSASIQFKRPYRVRLFNLPFGKGILFYLFFNLRAIGFLLFRKFDLVYANDLDTLLAGGLISLIKRKPLVYDSHELFTELPELVNRKVKRRLWILLERALVGRVNLGITVSEGVANELFYRYGKAFKVVRNVPIAKENAALRSVSENVIIYQGALNVGRGLEKLIEAMLYVKEAELVIAGTGDIEDSLISMTIKLGLTKKIHFTGRLSPEELNNQTAKATIGVSLEEDMGLNYRYALPNKLFDYIQMGLPVLVSKLPEMATIVERYNVGKTISSACSAKNLAVVLNQMLHNKLKLQAWRDNAIKASEVLCWEKEKVLFLSAIESVIKKD